MKCQAKSKPTMATRKKKDPKTTQDTVADTIAFVIKGQLTPIKATPLETGRKTRQVARQPAADTKVKTVKKPGKKKEDLNSSIQKIIKKYAKKFNIKRDRKLVVRKSRRTAPVASEEPAVKVKEEVEENAEVTVKTEPEVVAVKQEPEEPDDKKVNKKKRKRSKLVQFWNSPKRHRVASLNALAKVHCLYENESKTNFVSEDVKSDSDSDEEEEEPVKRTLRNVPGLVGKHWVDTLSSDNSDAETYQKPQKKEAKRSEEKKKRKPKTQEVYMDLKDMVVKKRMASLNASAILAASYDRPTAANSSSYDSDSSAEEYFAAKEEVKQEEDRNKIELRGGNNPMAVILNQDTDVTITGVYVNSTTRSTRHEGYCSIAGMQYRISATSHTQTAATTVATETLLQSSSSDNAPSDAQSCSSKSYTPLDALSNMQPPPGPGIHNTIPGIPCQVGSPPSHRQHSAFSSPHGYPGQRVPPPPGGAESHSGYAHGYYQPAGPLISVPLGHSQPPLPKSVPLSDASPTSLSSSTNHQPPPAPNSTNGDSSDNEVIITSVTAGTKELPPPPHPTYRYPQYYPYPPQYHYQTPPPPQTPPYPHHDLCYPAAPPSGFLRKYTPSAPYHRYPYYSGELYPPSTQPSQQMVQAPPIAGGGTYGGGTAIAPPPSAIMEPYPAPPPALPTLVDQYQPPPPHYYPSAYGLPPTCYSHTPNRAIQYINATYQHCPCPLNTCPKNGHTGPLTGESKRSNIPKDSKPLPPVALALPLEPVSATGPPSPARGSAGMPSGGMPPAPSPANYAQPPVRAARVGKEMVRKNIRMNNTMLLMCDPAQNCVKRERESPPERVRTEPDKPHEEPEVDACATTPKPEIVEETTIRSCTPQLVAAPLEEIEETPPAITTTSPPPPPPVQEEEPLPPCVATVAENVKVKNMKRKQSQTKEPAVPETPPPPKPKKQKKIGSYKDFIRKHKPCFKIEKKALVKTKLTKEQTNNRRIRRAKIATKKKNEEAKKGKAARLLDNLLEKNAKAEAEARKPKGGARGVRGRRKSANLRCKSETENVRRSASLPRWSNGWTWEGEPYQSKVFINSDETTLIRQCYPSMRHKEGDLIRPGDCVLLKAGPRKNDLPYVAKIASLWENPDDGEMMMSLLWYYRPEHTEQGRVLTDQPDEVFASRHKDSNSVACIDDKCYVLTFNEYCRYKKNYRRLDEGVEERPRYVPLPDPYPRLGKQPPFAPPVSPEMVFFCRKVYDFRQKRIIKNPT